MFNLTHNEDSGVDIGGDWIDPDQFELKFRINADDREDVNVHIFLTLEEIEIFVAYLQSKMAARQQRLM